LLLREAWEAKARLEAEGLSVRLVNVRMPKPIDVEAVLSAARETSLLVTVEDHFLTGGLFSIVSETLCATARRPTCCHFALEERWFKPALLPDVLRYEGFTGEQIAARILERLPARVSRRRMIRRLGRLADLRTSRKDRQGRQRAPRDASSLRSSRPWRSLREVFC
jgi:deoxyxylulose-5-phosphate synthase